MSKLAQELIEKEKEERTGYLDLGRCGLTEVPDLSELEWLETLILSNRWWDWEKKEWENSGNINNENLNKIISASSHCFPENLKKLIFGGDLWNGNWKTGDDYSFLEKLSNLNTLYLPSNQIRNLQFLEKLPNLKILDLSDNQITDGRFLEKLKNLNVLGLRDNKIQKVSFLSNLSNLIELDLGSNRMIDGKPLEKLSNLRKLDLSHNNLNNGQFLEQFDRLNYLNFRGNQISDWRFLQKLETLGTLDLRNNKINDCRILEKLTNLETLFLSENNIREGRSLASLKKLKILYLRAVKIQDWAFLEDIPGINTLDLGANQISDIGFLKNLNSLNKIYLSSNQISDGRYLESLSDLSTLVLRANQIKDVSFIEKLRKLTKIDLTDNKITDLSALKFFIKERQMKVVWKEWFHTYYGEINVKGNPFLNPPPNIVQKGNLAIFDYFSQKEKTGIEFSLEAKLILLGDGRAGKTSLANRLVGKPLPSETDRTEGIDISIGEYKFLLVDGRTFKLHIWDFAGQDKYKSLHQFFYTEGAVYIFVVDSGNAGTDYDDWFQTAKLFGEGSPVLVVMNEFREGIGYGLYDPEYWQKQFPNLLKEHFVVNLRSEKNLPALVKSIQHFAQSLLHTQMEYPKNWAAIRQELEQRQGENFISFQEYLKICKENDLPERDSALILSSILHKVGVCLHYQQSDLLRQYVILKNEWATDAVYKIMEDKQVAELKKGFFDWNDLRRIWSDDTYNEMRPQLLELMQKFKMAYPLPNSQEFVAPPLLLPAPPQGWVFPKYKSLELFIEYEFLPKALLTQFIVSRHSDIDEGRTLVWRNGVVLRWPDALAEVVKTKSQGRAAFEIHSQGNNRKGLLTSILKTFRDLHSEYNDIKVSEIVPCSCSGCQSGKNKQHYFDFENLKNRLEKGRRIVDCDKSLEEVELMALLGDLLVFEHLSVGKALVMKTTNIVRPDAEPKSAPLAFFSYSKADITHLKEFQKHLHPLERSDKIRLWDDLKIRPGKEWDKTIQNSLSTADIIFLLLSPDFLNTEYIWDIEMVEAIRRHEEGTARVIPIKVRPCAWEDTPFRKLQGLPRKDQVISTAEDQDGIWLEVVKEIKGILEDWC